jgi:DNA helicase HerA-like ATPase
MRGSFILGNEMADDAFNLPATDEHLAVLGCTGSGKTTLASWCLSKAPFDMMPYIAIDYKGDDLLGQIERLREIGLHEKIPSKPGLYVIRPLPSDKDRVEDWLWKVWSKGETGLYIDEAYLLPDKDAIQNILAQGRSLRIPVIAASQRPVNVPRSIFSEAAHIAVFRLNDRKDKQRVGEFTPPGMTENRLPDFHSWWYNVKRDTTFRLKPVPIADEIIDTINERLKPKVRVT